MVLLFLIDERLDRIVVISQIHNDLEIVLESRRHNTGHLISDRVLIALREVRPELLLVLKAPVLIGHLVEPFDEGRVRLWVEVKGLLPKRFRPDLLLVLGPLLDGNLAITGLVALVVRLSVRGLSFLHRRRCVTRLVSTICTLHGSSLERWRQFGRRRGTRQRKLAIRLPSNLLLSHLKIGYVASRVLDIGEAARRIAPVPRHIFLVLGICCNGPKILAKLYIQLNDRYKNANNQRELVYLLRALEACICCAVPLAMF